MGTAGARIDTLGFVTICSRAHRSVLELRCAGQFALKKASPAACSPPPPPPCRAVAMCSPSSRLAGRCRHTATGCDLPAMPATGAQEAGCPGAGGGLRWLSAMQVSAPQPLLYRLLLRTGSGRAHQAAAHCCLRGTPDAVEQPTLCCVPNARDFVQSFGLEFFPLGGDPQVRLCRSKAAHQHRRQRRKFGCAGRALRYQVQAPCSPALTALAAAEAAAQMQPKPSSCRTPPPNLAGAQ